MNEEGGEKESQGVYPRSVDSEYNRGGKGSK